MLTTLSNKYSKFCILFIISLASLLVSACIDYYMHQDSFSKVMQSVPVIPLFLAMIAWMTACAEVIVYCDSATEVEIKPLNSNGTEEYIIECIALMKQTDVKGMDSVIQQMEEYLHRNYPH